MSAAAQNGASCAGTDGGGDMPSWIACTDRLPDEELTVLVYAPAQSEPVWLGYLDDGMWRSVDPRGGSSILDVTHWMDLPEPPEPDTGAPQLPAWRRFSRALPKWGKA
jgi:hypothetical protein